MQVPLRGRYAQGSVEMLDYSIPDSQEDLSVPDERFFSYLNEETKVISSFAQIFMQNSQDLQDLDRGIRADQTKRREQRQIKAFEENSERILETVIINLVTEIVAEVNREDSSDPLSFSFSDIFSPSSESKLFSEKVQYITTYRGELISG